MIPESNLPLQDFEIGEQPTRTYQMNPANETIRGHIDGRQAMEQVIYKILSTERYQYIMYSWNYGIELRDLYGEPLSYVCPELERRITEALTWDDRIQSVDGFEFDTSVRRAVHVKFTAHTVYGDVTVGKVVDI